MNVLPVINCPDVECAQKKMAIVKTFLRDGDLVHLDIADGSFAAHKTWNDPLGWVGLKSPFGLEVHLMVNNPEKYADDWFTAGARRVIVHAEALTPQSMREIFSAAERHHQAEVVLSSKPETAMEDLEPYIKYFSAFQILAVEPGPADQNFLPFVAEKIRLLREVTPNATIEVDGGMNPETARLVKNAGADTITSSHYIFAAANPGAAYKELASI